LICDTPATGCAQLNRDSVDSGGVDFAVKLQQQLAPLIREPL